VIYLVPVMTQIFNNNDLVRMNSVLRYRLGNQISGIKNAVSLLAEELDGKVSPSIQEYFPLIIKECGSMDEMMKRMSLLFDAVQSGVSMKLQDLLKSITGELHSQYPKINIQSSASCDPAAVRLGNSHAASVAVREVCRNAAEAGGSGLNIECSATDADVEILVSDNGKGVPADKLPLVFDPFFTTKSRHIGIGLSIARKMIESMGGSIKVSNGKEAGTVVSLVCPLSRREVDCG